MYLISDKIVKTWVGETHILRNMCFLGRGTHIIRVLCFLGRATHITRDMCFPGEVIHNTRVLCFPGRGTRDRVMCFL